ncbi:MAG TPA: hypothetical protein VKH18_15605 [Terriglobales bacterium]|nr:hypothetical protein [Terriglobales bacterium]
MPIEGHILQDGMGRVWVCRGVISGKELIANNERILISKSYVRWLLIDETEATLEISATEIQTIRQQNDRLAAVLPDLVTAVLVPSDVGFGMARMWEILTARPGWSTRAFRSRPEAEAWLREEVRSKFAMELPENLRLP